MKKTMKIFATIVATVFLVAGGAGMALADNNRTLPGSGINPGGFEGRPGFDNGNAWWKSPSNNDPAGPGTGGWSGIGLGSFDIEVSADGYGCDWDQAYDYYYYWNDRYTYGDSLAFGETSGSALGGVVCGNIGGGLDVRGSGLANTDSWDAEWWGYDYYVEENGTLSKAYADTIGYGSLTGDGFLFGATLGLEGSAHQDTYAHSEIGDWWYWDDYTYGYTDQWSCGSWEADATIGGFLGGADASVGAGIVMDGGSWIHSYDVRSWDDDSYTRTMGTDVASWTNVDSSKNEDGNSYGCWTDSQTDVNGGWSAGGEAYIASHQNNYAGDANATADGSYFGAGNLGSNYNGSLNGSVYTSQTEVYGMNGTISEAGASMNVTSIVSGGVPD